MTISTKEDVTLPGLGRSGPHPEARPWGELVGEGLVNARVPGCVNLPVLLPERLVVTGADEPVYAQAGEDVTLSCSVNTTVNVTELQVEWKKTEDGIMVLQYNKGKIPERYSGRAEFYIEEIPKGNFSMKLRKVRFEDKGEFKCDVHSDTDSKSTTAWIAAVGESPGHLHKVSHTVANVLRRLWSSSIADEKLSGLILLIFLNAMSRGIQVLEADTLAVKEINM
uniref:Ig-like domain-containing protein n=1 Tax=Paramormyrops kingsleyae TaxID=1676925 RepID=A0A3B3S7A5_9TELE